MSSQLPQSALPASKLLDLNGFRVQDGELDANNTQVLVLSSLAAPSLCLIYSLRSVQQPYDQILSCVQDMLDFSTRLFQHS